MAPKCLHQTTEKHIFGVFTTRRCYKACNMMCDSCLSHRCTVSRRLKLLADRQTFLNVWRLEYEKGKMEQRSESHFQMPPIIDHQSSLRSEISTWSHNAQRGSNAEMAHKNSQLSTGVWLHFGTIQQYKPTYIVTLEH